jgi:hypothetical protein
MSRTVGMKLQSVALYASLLIVPFSSVQAAEGGESIAVRVKISLAECSLKTGVCKDTRAPDDEEVHIRLEQDADNTRSGCWKRDVFWRGKTRTLVLCISQDKLWTLEKGIKWKQGERMFFESSADEYKDISSVYSTKFERIEVTSQASHFLTFEGRFQ